MYSTSLSAKAQLRAGRLIRTRRPNFSQEWRGSGLAAHPIFENTLVLTGASGLLSGRANASSSPRLEDDGLALQARAGEGDSTIEEGWSHGKRLEGVV